MKVATTAEMIQTEDISVPDVLKDKHINHKSDKKKPHIVLLTSSLLTDRVFLYTNFLNELKKSASINVWATSARNSDFKEMWQQTSVKVDEFPQVKPFRIFPYSYLRWMNELVWDYSKDSPSRMSMMVHVRNKSWNMSRHVLKIPARLLAILKAGKLFENWLEKTLIPIPRCQDAVEIFKANPPDLLLTTSPFLFDQPGIVAVAKQLGIPTFAYIPSWDNLTLRTRMVFKYDGYIVWSEQTKRELHYYYPQTRNTPVHIVGAPQFDIFFQNRFYESREDFCAAQGLRPDLPIIVYALGSPNFIKEEQGAVDFAERVVRGELGNVQMLVRPHPIHDNGEMSECLKKYRPQVVLQHTAEAGTALVNRTQDEQDIVEWVNTFRHADVVVNLSSTVTIDAAIFDKPVVNINYDPAPDKSNQQLVKDINEKWTHFSPISQSGGVWLTNNIEETVEAVKTYLQTPELHKEKRRWIAEYVCGNLDGNCGERMAKALLQFARECERMKTMQA